MTKYYPGHRFGNLQLVSINRERYRALLVCDCGEMTEVQMSQLINGKKADCGCSEEAVIYFIRVNDYMKIGRCKNTLIAKRLAGVQVNCPYDAILVRTIQGTWSTEQALHRTFRDLHVRGEWFKFSEEMLIVELGQ